MSRRDGGVILYFLDLNDIEIANNISEKIENTSIKTDIVEKESIKEILSSPSVLRISLSLKRGRINRIY